MKVRTSDGQVHDLPAPDAVRLIHTSDAVPVVEDKVEKAVPRTSTVEKRAQKKS